MKPRPPIFPVVPVLLATSVLAATGLEAAPAYTIQPVPRPEWANSPLSISPIPRRINNRGVIMGGST